MQPSMYYEFGPFRFYPVEQKLLAHESPVPGFQARTAEVLQVLIENRHCKITTNELIEKVWGNRNPVESGALYYQINKLRKALGDDKDNPLYISFRKGRGIQFIAEVKEGFDPRPALEEYSNPEARIEQNEESPLGDQFAMQKLPGGKDKPQGARRLIVLGGAGVFTFAALIYFWNVSGETERKSVPAIQTLAVLPFKLLDADVKEDHLKIGIADSLITKLSNVQQLNVRPTSAIYKYTDPNQDPLAAGKELKASLVLEGKIRRVNDKIRITVQLIDVAQEIPLWGEEINELVTDMLTVEDIISEKVAASLALRLTGDEKAQLAKRYTKSPKAYELYLKGRYHLNKRTVTDLQKSIGYYQQALSEDPSYALAYAGIADSYVLLGTLGYSAISPKEGLPHAKAAAEKSLEIDSGLSEAHNALGLVNMFYDWDWSGAEWHLKKGIELNPNSATAHHWYANLLKILGRSDRALIEIKKAEELDPLSLIISATVGWIYYFARNYDEAIKQCQKTLEMDENFYPAHAFLGYAYAQKGQIVEAIAELQRAKAISNDSPVMIAELGRLYAVKGDKARAHEALRKLEKLSRHQYISAYHSAMIYAALGDKDKAFERLENAFEERSTWLTLMKVEPIFDSLRSDPRFPPLLQRLNFPQ